MGHGTETGLGASSRWGETRMTTSSINAACLLDFERLVQRAQATSAWIVAVCPPNSDHYLLFKSKGGSFFPKGSLLGGRTTLMLGGGKVTITNTDDSPDTLPGGQNYEIVFLGWSDSLMVDTKTMAAWRELGGTSC